MTEAQVVEILATHDIRNLKELRRASGAGAGCTCCHADLKDLIARHSGSDHAHRERNR